MATIEVMPGPSISLPSRHEDVNIDSLRYDLPISDLLDMAADLMGKPDGWAQHTLDNGRGGRCAAGALFRVLMDCGFTGPRYDGQCAVVGSSAAGKLNKAVEALDRVVSLRKTLPHPNGTRVSLSPATQLTHWNDQHDQSQAGVVAAFKGAAQIERRREASANA